MADNEESQLVPYEAQPCLAANRVVVLAPHPDDEVFGCGGCAAAHVDAGAYVQALVLTDGSGAGEPDIREAESKAAAQVLGTAEPLFWRQIDRQLQADEPLVRRLMDHIAQHDVQLMYAPSPWEIHPDHRAAALLALRAFKKLAHQSRNGAPQLAFFEVGAPLNPNRLIDITAQWSRKQEAMACFASQLARQDYRRHIGALNAFRTYTLQPEVEVAEALFVPTEAQAHHLLVLSEQGLHPREMVWRSKPLSRLRRWLTGIGG